jgi:hypothetical protein
MKTMKKMMTLLAVAGFILALAPAAQAAVNWTGGGGANNTWTNTANWDGDATAAGVDLVLTVAGTSVLDVATSSPGDWANEPGTAKVTGSGHVLVLATGGVLTAGPGLYTGATSGGTIRFDGGQFGNIQTWLTPRLDDTGNIEFYGGPFSNVDNQLYQPALIHVVGRTPGSSFNPTKLNKPKQGFCKFQFTLEAEGVETLALSSADPIASPQGSGDFELVVDGIQDYLDGGGTQNEWDLITGAADNDMLLFASGEVDGLVDGGLGYVTASTTKVTLTIIMPAGTVIMFK